MGLMFIKHKLAKVLEQAAKEAQQEGVLAATALPDIVIERPQNPEHGDYASSLPLKLARTTEKAPPAIAEKIISSRSLLGFKPFCLYLFPTRR